jgi:hypothetical protein
MFRFTKQVVCSLAVLAFAAPAVRAQPFVPIYPGGPTYGQYLSNLRAYGAAMRWVPPYALGYNPYIRHVVITPPVVYPYAGLPYNALITANPYGVYAGSPGYDPLLYANPYWPYYADLYGGYLRGTADLIDAQGRFAVQQQQAILLREQIKSERLANRRKLFDEYLYARDRLTTSQDERERVQAQELRRALTDPPTTEIWSAKALNDLLFELQKQSAKGVMATYHGPRAALDPDLLRRINVTTIGARGNIGLLRNGGRLTWPLALTGPEFNAERERLASLAPDAVRQAQFNNRVDPGSLYQMNLDLDRMQKLLIGKVRDLPPLQYIEARRFLNNLGDALEVLGQPDPASYFNGKYAARGQTVPDLVHYMTDHGLQFAPVVAGEEAAYVALHRALADYTLGLRNPGAGER